jgi:hypothetical protein
MQASKPLHSLTAMRLQSRPFFPTLAKRLNTTNSE